jgi:hypothetical protein
LVLLVLLAAGPRVVGGQQTTSVSGQFVVYSIDDFEGGGSHRAYRLRASDGRAFELLFTAPPRDLRSGDQIVVRGVEVAPGVLRVERYERRVGPAGKTAGLSLEAPAAPPVGEQRTAVLLLDFQDATQNCPTTDVEARLFSDSDSVNRLYQETSSGKVSFAGKAFGPFTIDDYRSQHCDPFGWAAEANALATAAGVDLDAYPRRVYLIATNPMYTCNWGGISEMAVTPSESVVEGYGRCGYQQTFAHELGHALGMHHANTDLTDSGGIGVEYADHSDFMGGSYEFFGHTNAPHKFQMGWVTEQAAPVISTSGRFPLRPLETPLDSPWWPSILRIARPGSDAYYFVSFRRRIGFDGSLDDGFAERTSIHRWAEDQFEGRTELVRTLGDDDTFAGPGFVVSQIARSAGGAFVEVAFSCERFAPIVSASAVTGDGVRTGIQFDVTVRNDDNAVCPPTAFSVAASGPAGWSISLEPSALTLAPKAAANVTARVSLPADAQPGTYELLVPIAGADPVQAVQVTVPVTVPVSRRGGGGGGSGGGGGNGGGGDPGCSDTAQGPLDQARCLVAALLADGPCAADGVRPKLAAQLRQRARALDRLLARIRSASGPRRANRLARRSLSAADRLHGFLARQADRHTLPSECAATTSDAVDELRPLLQQVMSAGK